MNINFTSLALAGITALVVTSCKNPSEDSTQAQVSEAKEITSKPGSGQKWVIDENSTITFVGSKVTGSHDGGFKSFKGHFFIDGGTLSEGGHQVTIDMDSTYSDNEKLTAHLKDEDFFNVAKFPSSTFTVTGIEEKSGPMGATHALTGNFELHGVTKSLTIPVKIDQSAEHINITADFFINRKDFGIAYAGKKDDLIRDEVVIRFDLHASPEK